MKLVIDIDEEYYEIIKHDVKVRHNDFKPYNIIANGTPLPEHHGRLIDADALMEYCQNDINKTVDCNDIARFPTIIGREK